MKSKYLIFIILSLVFLSSCTMYELHECNKLDGREHCYAYEAVELKDPSICEKLGRFDEIYSCYNSYIALTKDYAVCEYMPTLQKVSECYGTNAMLTSNSSLCSHISETEKKSNCYYSHAIMNGDASVCPYVHTTLDENYEIIEDENAESWCYVWVAEDTGNYSICELPGYKRNTCYTLLAMITKNSLVCDELDDGYRRSCLMLVEDE